MIASPQASTKIRKDHSQPIGVEGRGGGGEGNGSFWKPTHAHVHERTHARIYARAHTRIHSRKHARTHMHSGHSPHVY